MIPAHYTPRKGFFNKSSKILIGILSVIVSFILLVTFFDLQSDYEQYCTGVTGFFVELFDGGQCTDLENYMFITSIGTLIFGLAGMIFIILGLTTPSSSDHRLMIPQQYVQHPQQYVQRPQHFHQHSEAMINNKHDI